MSDEWNEIIGEVSNDLPSKKVRRKKKEIVRIAIPKFITHVNKSKTKYLKINGQNIYSGNLHHYTRASMVNQLHNYVKPFIDKELKGRDLSRLYPLSIRLEVHAPINYGSVRMIKGSVRWSPPKKDYVANWDADNLWIWGKIFNDALTQEEYIKDDSVSFITSSGGVKFIPVKDFSDRKLVFIITKDT